MEMPTISIFTHDSIGVGEDGPTHQPVEQLGSMRSIPGLVVFRPCDANECLEMWKYIMPLKDLMIWWNYIHGFIMFYRGFYCICFCIRYSLVVLVLCFRSMSSMYSGLVSSMLLVSQAPGSACGHSAVETSPADPGPAEVCLGRGCAQGWRCQNEPKR